MRLMRRKRPNRREGGHRAEKKVLEIWLWNSYWFGYRKGRRVRSDQVRRSAVTYWRGKSYSLVGIFTKAELFSSMSSSKVERVFTSRHSNLQRWTFASLMPTLIASVDAVNVLLGFLVYLTLARILEQTVVGIPALLLKKKLIQGV